MALEGDEDRYSFEGANFFRLEHLHGSFEFIEDLSQMFNIDVNERPDVRDTEVVEAYDGVDVVPNKLWTAHAPDTV